MAKNRKQEKNVVVHMTHGHQPKASGNLADEIQSLMSQMKRISRDPSLIRTYGVKAPCHFRKPTVL